MPDVWPRRGTWIKTTQAAYYGVDQNGEPKWRDRSVYYCSECHRRTIVCDKFCPECGAMMRHG